MLCHFLLQTVTFQAILVTDFINTYTKITYKDRGMRWSINLNKGIIPSYPAGVGCLFRDKIYYEQYRYSFFDTREGLENKKMIEKIDAVIQSKAYHLSTSGGKTPGRFYFQLNNAKDANVNPGYACWKWIESDKIFDTIYTAIDYQEAETCPPIFNQFQIFQNEVFANTADYICWKDLFPEKNAGNQERSKRCCYEKGNGALITTPSLVGGLNTYQRFSGSLLTRDNNMYSTCCSEVNIKKGLSSRSLCKQFINRRPVCTSKHFKGSSAGNTLIMKLHNGSVIHIQYSL